MLGIVSDHHLVITTLQYSACRAHSVPAVSSCPQCSGSIVVTTLDSGPGGSWFESSVGANII